MIEGMTFVANLKIGGAIALVEQYSPRRVAMLTISRGYRGVAVGVVNIGA